MRRLLDYFSVAIWQAGLGYIALWASIFWALDAGPSVFGGSGVCHPDEARVLFYWVCDPASPLSMLAAIINTALTVTLWAPVYIAAATVRPEALAIATPIVLTHVVGLPAAIFVAIRLMLAVLEFPRRIFGSRAAKQKDPQPVAIASEIIDEKLPYRPPGKPRSHFGLRGQSR
jgi:hypothetical protein